MIDSVCKTPIRRQVALALAGVALFASVAQGLPVTTNSSDIVGVARVLDGDTLDIGGMHVRLEGIDAPEAAQHCGSWNCGAQATNTLHELTGGKAIRCESRGRDKYGRVLGICFAGEQDINAEMVRRGLAWAFVKYSTTYVTEERTARAAKIGIWQSDTEPAWTFRQKRWAIAEDKAPENCAIKGNITAKGHIYHMPWSAWYDKVRIEPAKGERWFCSETEAVAAGWRPTASY